MRIEGEIEVSHTDPQIQIARRLRVLESLRIGLITDVAETFKSIHLGEERELTRSLGALIASAYLLGRQMGIAPAVIEQEVLEALSVYSLDDEALQEDAATVRRYLDHRA